MRPGASAAALVFVVLAAGAVAAPAIGVKSWHGTVRAARTVPCQDLTPIAWLESRIARLRNLPDGDASEAMRADLRETKQRLMQAGVDDPTADALTRLPDAAVVGESRAGAVRVMEAARRRIGRFDEASRRTVPTLPENARERLERILQDDVFLPEPERRSAAEALLRRVQVWIGNWIARAFGALSGHAGVVRTIVYVLLAVVLAGLGWWVVRLLARTTRLREVQDVPTAEEHPRDVETGTILAAAQAAIDRGDPGLALRLLQEAVVLALKRGGLLPDSPSLTDLEGVSALEATETASDAVRDGFGRLTALHDRVVYGGRPAQATAVTEALNLGRRLVVSHETRLDEGNGR